MLPMHVKLKAGVIRTKMLTEENTKIYSKTSFLVLFFTKHIKTNTLNVQNPFKNQVYLIVTN